MSTAYADDEGEEEEEEEDANEAVVFEGESGISLSDLFLSNSGSSTLADLSPTPGSRALLWGPPAWSVLLRHRSCEFGFHMSLRNHPPHF